MFKILISFLFAIIFVSECTVIKLQPSVTKDELGLPNNQFLRSTDEIASNWGPHIMEFLELIDVEKMVMVTMQYMSDPEVMVFMKFLFSPQFKELIWDFEMLEEFKEAFMFLASKGYDMESLINYVNTALNLPAYEIPKYILRNKKGISGLFEDIVNTLPLEDIKKLFESKLQTSPEMGDLFDTINSEDFMDIMRRMRENPKLAEFKIVFESYGFDFKFICELIKEITGNYHRAIFCE